MVDSFYLVQILPHFPAHALMVKQKLVFKVDNAGARAKGKKITLKLLFTRHPIFFPKGPKLFENQQGDRAEKPWAKFFSSCLLFDAPMKMLHHLLDLTGFSLRKA